MAEFRPRLDAPVLIGVGAAFAFHVGDVKRAPRALQRSGLEWAYRVSQEPGRLARRYAVAVPKFITGVVKNPPRAVTREQRAWSFRPDAQHARSTAVRRHRC